MFDSLHTNRRLQLKLGLTMGIVVGVLLQKAGLTRYDVIIGQLLFKDWTVVKVLLSAIIVGTLGVHWLKSLGLIRLQPKPASIGTSVVGGIIFGVGFALLGYCPGTLSGAIGQGALDALTGGLPGILLGAGVFAHFYPTINAYILRKGDIKATTFPEVFHLDRWIFVIPVVLVLGVLLWLIEMLGG